MTEDSRENTAPKPITWRYKIGEIAGFPIYLHLDLLVWPIVLIAADFQLGLVYICLTLLASIAVQGLAHTITCRKLGFGSGGIIIRLFGSYFVPTGINEMPFQLDRPARLRYCLMFLAGPASNFAIAGIACVFATLLDSGPLFILAELNFILAVINIWSGPSSGGGVALITLSSLCTPWRALYITLGIIFIGAGAAIYTSSFTSEIQLFSSSWPNLPAMILFYDGLYCLIQGFRSLQKLQNEFEQVLQKERRSIQSTVGEMVPSRRVQATRLAIIAGAILFIAIPVGVHYTIFGNAPGRLLFASINNSRSTSYIYTSNAMGFPQTRLSDNSGWDICPASSPDESKIAYQCRENETGQTGLCVMNSDGSNKVRLTRDGRVWYLSWSPDGTKIVFEYKSEIYTIDADGSNLLQLTNKETDASSREPVWSPDGQYIVFFAEHDGNSQISTVKADGSAPAQLIRTLTGYASHLQFSQDGYIYFDFNDHMYAGLDTKIYRMNIDGSDLTNLMQFTGRKGSVPALSPDGRKIAFVSDGCIYVMDPAEPYRQQLIFKLYSNHARGLVWSPDGKYIVLFSRGGILDNTTPYIITADGRWRSRLTASQEIFHLSWLP